MTASDRGPGTPPCLYLDYQSTTPVDPEVCEAMLPWLRTQFGNAHSAEHILGWRAHQAIETARAHLASLVAAQPEDIVFTSGATESNNLALLGVAARREAEDGRDTLITCTTEHASVSGPIAALGDRGHRVVTLPVDRDGTLRMDTFIGALGPRVIIVSIAVANNEVGTLQDIRRIGELCRSAGALFHVDGAQALTAMELPLGTLPVDLASLSAHKAYGPQGIGALYVAPSARGTIGPIQFGGGQQGTLRPGTLPTALCVGFGAASLKLLSCGDEERQRVRRLRDRLVLALRSRIPEMVINGSVLNRHPGNLNVRFPVLDARDVVQRLQPTLACSTGSACHSGMDEPSPVLRALGLTYDEARASIRFGVGRFTTESDIDAAGIAIAAAVRESDYHSSASVPDELIVKPEVAGPPARV
jgi:cysteine desulfurase